MKLKCIAVEDEPPALRKLVSFIDKMECLQMGQTFDNAIDAISYLKDNPVDLIFLDIQMEEFTGIQFLEAIKNRPNVIITTAYDKYALKGYEFDVADYLLKPYTFERFVQAVEKVYDHCLTQSAAQSNLQNTTRQTIPIKDYVFLKTEYRLEKVMIPDILYIEGQSEYLRVVTENKKIMTLQSFRSMEELLPEKAFARVHKSYMVAIDKIDTIERNRIKIRNMIIPVSESHKDAFYEKIGIPKQK